MEKTLRSKQADVRRAARGSIVSRSFLDDFYANLAEFEELGHFIPNIRSVVGLKQTPATLDRLTASDYRPEYILC